MRVLAVIGLGVSAVAGYALGRRHEELRDRIACMFGPRAEIEHTLQQRHRASYDTEFDHLADHEAAERHRIAAELRQRPLHERPRRDRLEEDETLFDGIASRALARDRDDAAPRVAPRPL
jgi:hypothetical protein